MKVNFDTKLMGLGGEALKSPTGGESSLKEIAIEALMAMLDEDRHQSGEEKMKRGELAEKVYAGGEVEITPEEASQIKKRIGMCYGPAVVLPAFRLLNG